VTDKEPNFAMNFVGFAGMGSIKTVEASIALTPEYDLVGVISAYTHKDGSRVLTLIFRPSDKKLGRKGYSLKEEWKQEPQSDANLPIKKEPTGSEDENGYDPEYGFG
jgi:hypothetical protein